MAAERPRVNGRHTMNTQAYAAELLLAKTLARQAGAVVMAHYASNFKVEYKNVQTGDPVTQADKDANTLIVEALQAQFPDDRIFRRISQHA